MISQRFFYFEARNRYLENAVHESLNNGANRSTLTEQKQMMSALLDILSEDDQRQKILELMETLV